MGRDLIARVSKTCGHRQADSGRIKLPSETVKNPDPGSFRPQNQRSRTQNPQQTRPQAPVERGWADKADSRPPPGARWLGGDWYLWHAPDGLRARAATGLGCVQACAEKLGVIEASYASAIIGVVDRPLFRRGGTTQPKGLISTAWASISTEVWIESASWFQTARNSERSSSRRCKCMYIHSRSVRCAPTAQQTLEAMHRPIPRQNRKR